MPMNYRVANVNGESPNKDEKNAKFFDRMGFSEDGDCYIVLGNTYEIKDQLKQEGARFNPILGWYFSEPNSKYNCVHLFREDFMDKDFGLWYINEQKAEKVVNEIKDDYAERTSKSNYVGEIGERYSDIVKLVNIFTFTSNYSYYGELIGIYKFEDKNGNIIVWKTAFKDNLNENNFYELSGVIKDHSKYRNEKQTTLTRCKYRETNERF